MDDTTRQVYLLKDVSRLSGHSVHTLKFYLKRGLIHEAGRTPETGFRYFSETTLTRLSQIRAFRRKQKSLAEIQQLLEVAPPRLRSGQAGSELQAPSHNKVEGRGSKVEAPPPFTVQAPASSFQLPAFTVLASSLERSSR